MVSFPPNEIITQSIVSHSKPYPFTTVMPRNWREHGFRSQINCIWFGYSISVKSPDTAKPVIFNWCATRIFKPAVPDYLVRDTDLFGL